MWPSALQLTRDECRGILRRLELESYSNVISVFRAQGGLSDSKTKLLEDLRNIFHISQERHRAEARRVANDEQLSTIAEAISGPNTWQEWSREGRRTYPLLPRVPPQTALSILANNVASEITNENSKLPYPSETGSVPQQHQEFSASTERTSESVPIVTSDPLQPEIPEMRKTLKRNLPSDALTTNKKRIMSELFPSATNTDLPLSSSTQIRKLYHNHSKTQSKQKNALSKKTNNSPVKRPSAANKKRLTSGDSLDLSKTTNSQTMTVITADSTPPPQSQEASIEHHEKTPTPTISTSTPQIATSKKDISKNLSKLNIAIANQAVLQSPQQNPTSSDSKTEKFSTPVQKYIVEERTPMLVSNATALPSHLFEKQQVITSKVKSMSAIVPTPLSMATKAKITNVKTLKSSDLVCTTPVSSQPQVFNVIDASTPPYVPHTPPAIINLSSKFEPEHGKVLTTKLLPLMLSSSGKLESSNGNPVHVKNVNHPMPSTTTTTTVFRKPNIIKSGMPMKQKIQITNQQIISPPNVPNLKMSPHLHLKGVPGGGPIHNRKSVKIFSSPNGKMFIQSADSSSKPMGKMNTIVSAQKAAGQLVNTGPSQGRIAIQKVQIFPAPSSTSGSNVVQKPISIAKPNMIFMPMASPPAVKSLPIVKSNKYATLNQESSVHPNSSAKSNVFVIGAVQSSPQAILPKDMQSFNSRSNMITEDTPVDIISSPIIVDVDSIDEPPAKNSETIDLTSLSDKVPAKAAVSVSTPTTVLQSRSPASDACYVESSAISSSSPGQPMEAEDVADGESARSNTEPMVIGVTDWEMELDQEASKTRAMNAHKIQKPNDDFVLVESGGEDENFADDVIEENEETEEETEDSCDVTDEQRAYNKTDQETQEKQPHQEQHHRHYRQNDDEEDDDESIEVGDEQMKSEDDVIQFDESYESVNDDLDENIAIEYVEEDQDGYEEKIDSTCNDRKETMECNSNIVLIKQSSSDLATETESSENKSQPSNDCMVSVEEISSTTQQNTSGSQGEN